MKSICSLIGLLLFIQCGDSEENHIDNSCSSQLNTVAEGLMTKLDNYDRDTDFTLLLASENGRSFSHNVGNSSASTSYRSASTSKWVTAVVILSLIEDGVLNLNDNPQDYIDFWPTTGNHSLIELKHLLNFTSGLVSEPLCINFPNSVFENCIEFILDNNQTINTPGTEFFYGSSHMQVAGLMAVKATGMNSWEEIFNAFKTKTGLFAISNYDLPSIQNPRLAGGMHWTGTEYMEFLDALYYQKILTPNLIQMLQTDGINNSTILYSPAKLGVNQDWHYGLGNWVECNSLIFNCTELNKFSSPGAFGAYPFIDYEHNYFGILAREGDLNTFVKGYELFTHVEPELELWASLDCN